MKKIFILDSLGYLFRSYYAIRHLNRPTGESTNALYGFIRAILKIIKDFEPTHLVAVFDGPNNTKKRSAIYPEYKANRQHPPEDLPHQLEWAYEFCEIANIPRLRVPNVEADDVMAAIALWADQNNHQAFICSSDKDLFQLVRDNISIVNTNKNNLIYQADEVKEHYGVWPSQIRDYLTIVGDASDNVPGVKGFGPKTAQNLLVQAETLDELIANPDKYLTGKKRETFLNHLDQLDLSRRLVTLDLDVEFPKELDFYSLSLPEKNKLAVFFEDMNFKSLLKEFQQEVLEETPCVERMSIPIINDSSQLDDLIEELSKQKTICFDTETSHLAPISAQIVGLGIGYREDKIWYIPFNDRIEKSELVRKLKPLFENSDIGFYAHHIKYDMHILLNLGIELKTISDDTILQSYLLTPNIRQHSLDNLSLEYFNFQKIPIKDLIGTGKNQKSMSDIEIEKVAQYCGEDVLMTIKLNNLLKEKIKDHNLLKVYQEIELPLIPVLLNMERCGIYVDVEELKVLKKSLNEKLENLEQATFAMAGETFNLKSPKQLGEILFQKLEIPTTKKTKTGYSTSAEALEMIEQAHPIIEKILEFRTLEKLRSTYVESLVNEPFDQTQRVHCSFNQTIAATGRLSCQDPNLQNIPIRTEQGREIRKAFKPQKKGWSFLSADYSQIELRLLAHYSQDPHLIETFISKGDVHTSTAAKIFNLPINEVTKEHRSLAKAVNFGIIYGQQSFGLSKQLKISVGQAKEFIEAYFKEYPKVSDYIESCKQEAAEKCYTETLFGRKRPLHEINSKNKLLKQAAERLAVNSPFQGSNADIIKIAMAKINQYLKDTNKNSFMILQIHDELLFEVEDSEIEDVTYNVKKIMENIIPLKVPLTIDIKIGKNWKEC
ncbi:MAG: DNA polymerase I [Chlamydiae bacterium]|nr:DNA polymerase I [Chlamydiota bacterium]